MERHELDAWLTELNSTINPIIKEINTLKSDIDQLKKRVEFLDGLPTFPLDQILRNDYVKQVNVWEKRIDLLSQDRERFINVRDEVIKASQSILNK